MEKLEQELPQRQNRHREADQTDQVGTRGRRSVAHVQGAFVDHRTVNMRRVCACELCVLTVLRRFLAAKK